jgi:hypothetical protein
MLLVVKAYFVAHSGHELIPPRQCPANRRSRVFRGQSTGAAHGVQQYARSFAGQQLRLPARPRRCAMRSRPRSIHRMSGLLAELGQLLGFDDPLWYAFGFSRPSDPKQPQQPENLTLVAGAVESGMVFADWDDARRAERYRVFAPRSDSQRRPGRVIGDVTESEFVITDQVSGHNVEVWTIAVNDAGDSPESGHHSIVVP